MSDQTTVEQIRAHLAALVRWPDGRPVGSPANHAAQDAIAEALAAAGYEVEQQSFDCLDWQLEGPSYGWATAPCRCWPTPSRRPAT